MPQGKPTHSPARGCTSRTRPKRRTTARSPGRTSVTPVSTQATSRRASSPRTTLLRRMAGAPLAGHPPLVGRALSRLARTREEEIDQPRRESLLPLAQPRLADFSPFQLDVVVGVLA